MKIAHAKEQEYALIVMASEKKNFSTIKPPTIRMLRRIVKYRKALNVDYSYHRDNRTHLWIFPNGRFIKYVRNTTGFVVNGLKYGRIEYYGDSGTSPANMIMRCLRAGCIVGVVTPNIVSLLAEVEEW